jgi:hypothetical protein
MVLQLFTEASAKSNRSSAKKRWEKEGPLLEALIGFQFLFWQASKILRLRYSIHKINKYGDKGSPCLIPLDGLNSSIRPPLKRIEIVEEETQSMINLTKC